MSAEQRARGAVLRARLQRPAREQVAQPAEALLTLLEAARVERERRVVALDRERLLQQDRPGVRLGLDQVPGDAVRAFRFEAPAGDVAVAGVALGAAWALKAFYSAAGFDQLRWVLAPTVQLVSMSTGVAFDLEPPAPKPAS